VTHTADDRQQALNRVLRHLQDDSQAYFGVPTVRLQKVRHYDSEASLVVHVRVEGGSDVSPDIFVKAFKPRTAAFEHTELARTRVANDFAAARRVHDQMARFEGFAAVRPIACFPEDLVVVTERAAGETLGTVLKRDAAWWPTRDRQANLNRIMARTGGWIRAFQSCAHGSPTFSLEAMREYVDVRLRRLTAMPRARFSHHWRTRILRYFDSRSSEVNSGDLREVPIHADVAPGNVLVSGDRITVIDFAMAASGGVYHDVARLFSQLEFFKNKPKFRPSVIDELQSALLNGFEPGLSPQRPLFDLFVLQHRLCHLANLSGHPGSGPSRAYNWYQRMQHRRWLAHTCTDASF
jgi:hypothetical protein